jgi:hypothetical protein
MEWGEKQSLEARVTSLEAIVADLQEWLATVAGESLDRAGVGPLEVVLAEDHGMSWVEMDRINAAEMWEPASCPTFR